MPESTETGKLITGKTMKLINTNKAAGHTLCHDMTEVIPGKYKGTRFRRGHVVTEADIPVLLDMGKDQLYVLENEDGAGIGMENMSGMLHEEDAAEKLCFLLRGDNLRASPVREGKIELFAESDGLLKINSEKLLSLNSVDGLTIMTQRGNQGVKKSEKIAAFRVIPLLIEEEKINFAAQICGGEKLINIVPYKKKKAGIIVTGNEIFHGRKSETGSEILKKKIEILPAECVETLIFPDEVEKITAGILDMINRGFELIVCTGGMSVDPDDKTPLAIKNTGARLVSHGVPFMPGVMLLLAYYEKNALSVPIIGAPACVFYEHITALDILLPRLIAGDPISRRDLALLGEGGLGG